ncbi:MAG: ATP-dependent zinc metalloprotease FtsH [Chloroflexi bacterium]|nr:ATP-dependent zinc metalloprotease FtsH [Chloroflexota bacterium]
MNKNLVKNGFIYLVIIIIAVIIFSTIFPFSSGTKEVPFSTVKDMIKRGEVKSILVEENSLTVTSRDDTKVKSLKEERINMNELLDTLGAKDVTLEYKEASGFNWSGILMSFLPLILMVGLIIFLFSRAQGANSQALNFGRSRARLVTGSKPTVTFADVAGVEEAKQELHEVVEFLKGPEKFLALGARIPRGVLVVGPPGTGKTLLARAVAGEAGVPFFSISGSEFVEMFVGVGASRVRDLFDQAKRNAPCIVFVDEIDAVGRHRGAGLGGSHDEREQTLNQILVEMDGFDTNTNVIVLAATNRPDILDPALLRPGRFDRQVVLDRPDIAGRKAILEVHTKGKPLDSGVNLDTLAKQTPGFSGADLANLVNEGAILSARRNKKLVGMAELEEAIDRVIAGPEKRSRIINPRQKEVLAYHEAGHALVARLLPNADPVHKISIVARGMMGGYTRLLPTEDRVLWTRSQFNDMLAVSLAGRAAEEIAFNEMTTGAENDIEHASKIARKMVTEYGMSDKLGPRSLGRKEELVFLGKEISEQRNYSERMALEIDREVDSIVKGAHSRAVALLVENRTPLSKLAARLISQETIEGEELAKFFNEVLGIPAPVASSAPSGVAAPVASNEALSPAAPKPAAKPSPKLGTAPAT